MEISRRTFLKGCSTAIAALAGSRLTGFGFLNPALAAAPSSDEILVSVFLRGGIDGLNVVVPYNEGEYYTNRPRISIAPPGSGTRAAFDLNGQFGLHPAAGGLRDLYQANKLAFVHAAGLTSDTRSHFDAMEYMERGTPGNKTTTTGWMTRHLAIANQAGSIPALGVGAITPTVFLGSPQAVSMANVNDFTLYGDWGWQGQLRRAMRSMYTGDTLVHRAGERTLNAIDIIDYANPDDYVPANGAVYEGELGEALKLVAQVAKLDLGLHVASVDLGGWDTHENQGEDGEGYFAYRLEELSKGLMAFYTDMLDYANRVTVVVMSEFGRRLRENADAGTDHGHGNMMMVLGGNVNGGHVYSAPWPGLQTSALDEGVDLAITTDYRRVLSEILIRRLGNAHLGTIFPGYSNYAPLGIVNGADIPPIYGDGNRVFLPGIAVH
ncbi:MAG: DUF1501 domain-containing protein [Caldilineales bacterium]